MTSAVAVATHLGRAPRDVQVLSALGLGLYVGVVAVTRAVHLSLNARMVARRAGGQPEIGVLRHAVEGPWVRWHRVRTGMAVGALTSMILALAAGSRGGGVS